MIVWVQLLFWLGVGTMGFTYVVFPRLLWLLALTRGAEASPCWPGELPLVSVIIAAYNEEVNIERRLQNLREQDYPQDRLEIIVASDGSSDHTVARALACDGVRVLEHPGRAGRATVHNDAAARARGEILIFTDAETSFAPDFIATVVPFFGDPSFACGSGEYSFQARGQAGQTENDYWAHERQLRRDEFRLGILPFTSGGCFAVRRELFISIPAHADIDDYLAYALVVRGFQVFYAAAAQATDFAVDGSAAHYLKRVRTALLGMQGVLGALPPLLRRGRFGHAAVLICHRLLRWLGGAILPMVLISNLLLAHSGAVLYGSLLTAQIAFYAAGVWGWLQDRRQAPRYLPVWGVARVAYGFIIANAAFARALLLAIKGARVTSYTPASQIDTA